MKDKFLESILREIVQHCHAQDSRTISILGKWGDLEINRDLLIDALAETINRGNEHASRDSTYAVGQPVIAGNPAKYPGRGKGWMA